MCDFSEILYKLISRLLAKVSNLTAFESLFSPLDIGPVEIRNRIQITPHELQYMRDGLPTNVLHDYFVERAKGGVGLSELSQLIIKPAFGVHQPDWEYQLGRRFPIQNSAEIVPGLRKMNDQVHEFGSKIFMEVSSWMWIFGPISSIPFETGLESENFPFHRSGKSRRRLVQPQNASKKLALTAWISTVRTAQ